MNNIDVICLKTDAFYALLDQVIERIDEKYYESKQPTWIDGSEVMEMLGITSRTTLGTIKDSGKIKVSIISKKVVLYDRQSVLDYIESYTKKKF